MMDYRISQASMTACIQSSTLTCQVEANVEGHVVVLSTVRLQAIGNVPGSRRLGWRRRYDPSGRRNGTRIARLFLGLFFRLFGVLVVFCLSLFSCPTLALTDDEFGLFETTSVVAVEDDFFYYLACWCSLVVE